jgi:dicarboxylate transporter 10
MSTVLYGTSRFALYETIKTYYQRQSQDPPTLSVLIPAAAASGFVGGIIGNPADLANVRMQCDRGLPLVSRRGYSHIFDAWIRMAKEEGWQCLMRGWGPNAIRAGLMTSSQLASYDSFKSILTRDLGMGDNMRTHFASSVLASLVATTVCSPVDVIKTRIMSSSEPVSVPKLVRHISRAEGLRWMWRGWVPSFGRLGPQTVVTFMLLEQHKLLYRTLYGL